MIDCHGWPCLTKMNNSAGDLRVFLVLGLIILFTSYQLSALVCRFECHSYGYYILNKLDTTSNGIYALYSSVLAMPY